MLLLIGYIRVNTLVLLTLAEPSRVEPSPAEIPIQPKLYLF